MKTFGTWCLGVALVMALAGNASAQEASKTAISDLAQLDSQQWVFLFLTVAAVAFAISGAVCGVASQWRRARQAEVEATLKAQMIDRGPPADEIERVLIAGKRTVGHVP